MTQRPPTDRRSDARIDDLLGFDEEPLPVEDDAAAGSRLGWLLRNLLLVLVATAVTVGGLRIVGVRVPVLLVLAGFVALRLVQVILGEVAPPPVPRAHRRAAAGDGLGQAGTDALREAVRRWESRLDRAQGDAGRFSSNLLPVLAELTDERLRLRHGITRGSDPRRARELLGDPLWQLLAEPDRRSPKARELMTHVETLEKL